jgi:hypothetical protein
MQTNAFSADPNRTASGRAALAPALTLGRHWRGAADARHSGALRAHTTTNPGNEAKSHLAQLAARLRHEAVQCGRLCVAALILLLLPAANAGAKNGPGTLIPKVASIAGIKVGYSSMDELERQLGQGKTVVGGHPNGARIWRVKGTSWVIYADAFEYSQRGAVVDSFDINVNPKPGPGVPYTRMSRKGFAWLGKISLGMDEARLLEILKQKACVVTKVAEGWQVNAKGYSPLTSDTFHPFQEWTVQLIIKKKALIGMQFAARQESQSK